MDPNFPILTETRVGGTGVIGVPWGLGVKFTVLHRLSYLKKHFCHSHLRSQSIEVLDQRPSFPSERRNSSPASGVEVKPRRPVVPIPCHPRAVNNNPLSLPWSLSEPSNWANVAAMVNSHQMQNTRLQLPHFPNLIAPPPQLNPRRLGFSPSWHKHSIPRPTSKESTVGHKYNITGEHTDNPPKPPAERVPREAIRDAPDGPLDLSDRGKTNPNQSSIDDTSPGEGKTQRSSDNDGRTRIPASSPSLCVLPSSSHSTPQTQQNLESGSERKNGVMPSFSKANDKEAKRGKDWRWGSSDQCRSSKSRSRKRSWSKGQNRVTEWRFLCRYAQVMKSHTCLAVWR